MAMTPGGGFRKPLHEKAEAGFEFRRIEQAKYAAERIVTGDTVVQTEELTKEQLLCPAEQRHVRTIFPTAQSGGEPDDKDFEKVMTGVIIARIFQAVEAGGKLLHEGTPMSSSMVRI